ncbi:MAG: hypothetical protein EHM14_15765, partial [Methanothrix sp.]
MLLMVPVEEWKGGGSYPKNVWVRLPVGLANAPDYWRQVSESTQEALARTFSEPMQLFLDM